MPCKKRLRIQTKKQTNFLIDVKKLACVDISLIACI